MSSMLRVLLLAAIVAMLLPASVWAQPENPCPDCERYCTFTPGAWGSPCHGGNAGCLLEQHFAAIFPFGLTVGGINTMHFSSAVAIQNYYPELGPPAALQQSHVNPIVTESGIFGGHMVAFTLNLAFANAGINGQSDFGDFVIAMGPFAGYTVNQLSVIANAVIGGDMSALPPGTTLANVHNAVAAINNNFDNCVDNDGYLVMPGAGRNMVLRTVGQELPLQFCLEFTPQCPDVCLVWWCQACEPDDYAIFTQCAEDTTCDPACDVAGGLVWGEQVVLETIPGQGCWWYVPVHAEVPGCVCVTFEYQLAAELLDFAAVPGDGRVLLEWSTAAETDNDYFEISRDGSAIARVEGAGSSSVTSRYVWTDHGVANGTAYAYTLTAVDVSGARQELATESATPHATIPGTFALHQNYPNPFNPSTNIAFDVDEAAHIRLAVLDPLGREIAVLVDRRLAPQSYEVKFDAAGLPSGLYFYRLSDGSRDVLRKMILLK